MTTAIELLKDGFGRVQHAAHAAVDGLDPDALATQIEPGTNTVAWLVWHLARVQDDHVAAVAGTEQVWTAGGWQERSGLPFGEETVGYGFSLDEMAQVRGLSAEQLLDYLDAVHAATAAYLDLLSDADLDRVVDEGWDPPVTLAVRLVSVLDDDLEHAGQAALIAGILSRR